jgi:hypothetical protein
MGIGNVINFVAPAGSNLPPSRAALARCISEIEATGGEVARLREGRAKLEENLAALDAGRQALEAEVNSDAAGLVAKLKAGVEAFGEFAGWRTQNAAAKLGATAVDGVVIETALKSVGTEIERLEGRLAELTERKRGLVLDAVREAAQGYFEDYDSLLNHLGAHMAILGGLEKYLGVQRIDRLVAIVPSFTKQDGLDERPVIAPSHEKAAAMAVWQKVAEAIDADPAAPIEDMLQFPRFDGIEDPNLPYENRSSLEQKLIDLHFSPYYEATS